MIQKSFLIKKLLRYKYFKGYKNIFCKIHYGLAMAFCLSKMNSKLHGIYYYFHISGLITFFGIDKEAWKRKGAWLHWFRCHTHRSNTYAAPCSKNFLIFDIYMNPQTFIKYNMIALLDKCLLLGTINYTNFFLTQISLTHNFNFLI